MTEKNKRKLISVREAAKECGRNMETVRRWIWAGKLPAEKLGNQLFIKREDLVNYCRETAVRYEARPTTDFLERAIALREQMKARGVKPFNAVEEIRKMREERAKALEEGSVEGETTMKAGSRVNLIKRMGKLREEIRARVGNLDAVGTLEKLRQERTNDLTNLR